MRDQASSRETTESRDWDSGKKRPSIDLSSPYITVLLRCVNGVVAGSDGALSRVV